MLQNDQGSVSLRYLAARPSALCPDVVQQSMPVQNKKCLWYSTPACSHCNHPALKQRCLFKDFRKVDAADELPAKRRAPERPGPCELTSWEAQRWAWLKRWRSEAHVQRLERNKKKAKRWIIKVVMLVFIAILQPNCTMWCCCKCVGKIISLQNLPLLCTVAGCSRLKCGTHQISPSLRACGSCGSQICTSKYVMQPIAGGTLHGQPECHRAPQPEFLLPTENPQRGAGGEGFQPLRAS